MGRVWFYWDGEGVVKLGWGGCGSTGMGRVWLGWDGEGVVRLGWDRGAAVEVMVLHLGSCTTASPW